MANEQLNSSQLHNVVFALSLPRANLTKMLGTALKVSWFRPAAVVVLSGYNFILVAVRYPARSS